MVKRALFLIATCAGCVSVSLPKAQLSRAKANFQPPAAPFVVSQNDKADQAWRNPNNGNSISYFSSCNDPSDPAIEAVQTEMLAGIADVRYESRKLLTFNAREAVRAVISGTVDGVAAKMDVLVFKKNRCLYGLSFVGLPKSFDSDHPVFETFVQGFQAP